MRPLRKNRNDSAGDDQLFPVRKPFRPEHLSVVTSGQVPRNLESEVSELAGIEAAQDYWIKHKQVQEAHLYAFNRQLKLVQELIGKLGKTDALRAEMFICETRIEFIEFDLLETEREINRLWNEWYEKSTKGS